MIRTSEHLYVISDWILFSCSGVLFVTRCMADALYTRVRVSKLANHNSLGSEGKPTTNLDHA